VGLVLRYYKSQGHLRCQGHLRSRGSKEPISAVLLLSFCFNLHRAHRAHRVEHRAAAHRAAQRVEHRAQRVN
jgi:hypothetical protein